MGNLIANAKQIQCLVAYSLKYNSREAESENVTLVVQGMLMKFECRFLKRMVWCISFDIWLCLNVVHSYSIHGNT